MTVSREELAELIDPLRGVPDGLALNSRSCYTVKQAGRWLVEIVPMIYNFRVVLSPIDTPDGYDHGWCYIGRDGGTFARAWLAAVAFDPTTTLEPPGYDKCATPRRRSVED